MPEVIPVPEPIPKEQIPKEGIEVVITAVREVKDQWTSIGTLTRGLGLVVDIGGKEYSALFSLDRQQLTGSVGRLLAAVGVKNTDAPDFMKQVKGLVGKKVRLVTKGGKLYWYP